MMLLALDHLSKISLTVLIMDMDSFLNVQMLHMQFVKVNIFFILVTCVDVCK